MALRSIEEYATMSAFSIEPVRSSEDLKSAIDIILAYHQWLNEDVSFQGWQEEIDGMPGKYAPPKGELFLARDTSGLAIGCLAVRPLTEGMPLHQRPSPNSHFPYYFVSWSLRQLPDSCEMKRLFILPAGRGLGVGKALVQHSLEFARGAGYKNMKLDTLPHKMGAANKLYKDCGFKETEPYYHNPIKGVLYLSCDLNEPDRKQVSSRQMET